jgi:hypothetical protein
MATIGLKMEEIDMMRGNLLAMVDFIYKNRFRMDTQDGKQLTNHLQYSLDILSTISNKLQVQLSEPCYSPSCYNTGAATPNGPRTLIYTKDGTTRIVDAETLPRTNDGWEAQFDSTLLLNPPCFTMPPQNVTNLSTLRRTANRT